MAALVLFGRQARETIVPAWQETIEQRDGNVPTTDNVQFTVSRSGQSPIVVIEGQIAGSLVKANGRLNVALQTQGQNARILAQEGRQ